MVVILRENRLKSLSCAFDKTNSDLHKDSFMRKVRKTLCIKHESIYLLPSRRHPSSSRKYKGKYLQLKYAFSVPEKISICLNTGREESWGNGDVLALNNAERPRVRNSYDNVKQKMPDRTAWVESVTVY